MTTYHKITPAGDESLIIGFEVPRKGKEPLRFTLPNNMYLPLKIVEEYEEWIENEWKGEIPLGNAQLDFFADKLLGKRDAAAVKRLTNGEKFQIFAVWQENSQINLGESEDSTSD